MLCYGSAASDSSGRLKDGGTALRIAAYRIASRDVEANRSWSSKAPAAETLNALIQLAKDKGASGQSPLRKPSGES